MFVLGYYAVKYGRDFIKRIDRIPVWLLGLLFVIVIISKLYIVDSAMVMNVCSVIGIGLTYRISGEIMRYKISAGILWCSQFSFFIYAFHEFYEAMFKKIVMLMVPQNGFVQLIEYFMIPTIMVGVCIVMGKAIKEHVPALYNVFCGYRGLPKSWEK